MSVIILLLYGSAVVCGALWGASIDLIGSSADGFLHEGLNLFLDRRAGQVQFDQMADQLPGQRGDEHMTAGPNLYIVVVVKRPLHAMIAELHMQREHSLRSCRRQAK